MKNKTKPDWRKKFDEKFTEFSDEDGEIDWARWMDVTPAKLKAFIAQEKELSRIEGEDNALKNAGIDPSKLCVVFIDNHEFSALGVCNRCGLQISQKQLDEVLQKMLKSRPSKKGTNE